MPLEFLRRKPRVNHRALNGPGLLSVIFSRLCVNGQPVTYAAGLARLQAHGWDPLIPTYAGVYDGLQGAPRYVYLKGESIRGSTCLQ